MSLTEIGPDAVIMCLAAQVKAITGDGARTTGVSNAAILSIP